MNKKKLTKLFLLCIVCLLIAFAGNVIAYMFTKTDYKDNKFSPANVSCSVVETVNTDVSEKSSITVKNTGNINAYLRVRFVSYWVQDNEGTLELAAKASKMPEFEIADGWLKGSNDTYYYQFPVAPDTFSGELLASPILLSEEDGYLQVVEVFAEAIQSKPETSATDSWGVTINENGIISHVPR